MTRTHYNTIDSSDHIKEGHIIIHRHTSTYMKTIFHYLILQERYLFDILCKDVPLLLLYCQTGK